MQLAKGRTEPSIKTLSEEKRPARPIWQEALVVPALVGLNNFLDKFYIENFVFDLCARKCLCGSDVFVASADVKFSCQMCDAQIPILVDAEHQRTSAYSRYYGW